MPHRYWVYILSNKRNGTIYTGVTNDLARRMYEHKHNRIPGFTSRYEIHQLIYFHEFSDIKEAILAEKQIKGWTRKKKIALIELKNPSWQDLSLLDSSLRSE